MKTIFQLIRKKIEYIQHPLVYVSGFGGAGKTTFCQKLQEHLGDVVVVSDWFLAETETRKVNIKKAQLSGDMVRIEREENPIHWYNWDQFAETVEKLRKGRSVSLQKVWNQKTGKRDLNISLEMKKGSAIICDGIHLLHPDLPIPTSDIKIWLEVDPQKLIENSQKRDRHRNDAEYLAQKKRWFETYELPLRHTFRKNADIVIDNNDFSCPKTFSPEDF